MIKCKIIPQKEYLWSNNEKTKIGKYHGSYFWGIPGFGKNRWVVGISLKYENNDDEIINKLSLEEKSNRCLDYIKQKRISFRKFDIYQSKEIDHNIIIMLLIVDKRKSIMFWGKGQSDIR